MICFLKKLWTEQFFLPRVISVPIKSMEYKTQHPGGRYSALFIPSHKRVKNPPHGIYPQPNHNITVYLTPDFFHLTPVSKNNSASVSFPITTSVVHSTIFIYFFSSGVSQTTKSTACIAPFKCMLSYQNIRAKIAHLQC